MKFLRTLRHWSLLPAIVWLAMQLAMAAGGSASARAGTAPAGDLAPLVGELDPGLWLCGPNGGTLPGGDEPAAGFSGGCEWCQAFGAMPEPAAAPTALPAFTVAVLANQPFSEPAAAMQAAPNTGFRSRAPPR